MDGFLTMMRELTTCMNHHSTKKITAKIFLCGKLYVYEEQHFKQNALTTIFVFVTQQNLTAKKGCSKKTFRRQRKAKIQVSIHWVHLWNQRCHRLTLQAHTCEPLLIPLPQTIARVEKVCWPTVSAAKSSKEWSFFLTRWQDYAEATKITGKDKIAQLPIFESCDEQLHKDLIEHWQFTHQQICGQGDGSNKNTCCAETTIQWLLMSKFPTCINSVMR